MSLKVNHVYELYPLYLAMYGRPRHTKAYDSLTACIAVERWAYANEITKLNVLELFAGKSEHREHFEAQFAMPERLSKYQTLDLHADPSTEVIKGNALNYDFKPHNVVLAFYYSLGTTFIQGQVDPRQKLDEFTANLYQTTPKHSCAFFHISDGNQKDAMNYVCHSHDGTEYPLFINHPLLHTFGLHGHPGMLRVWGHKTYDRLTSNTYEHIKVAKVYDAHGTLLGDIKVKEPFVQRFWTEPEIVDSFRVAGFKNFDFYNNDLSYGEHHEYLKRIIHSSDESPNPHPKSDEQEVERYIATEILVYK